jgi:hypothetical protein
MNVLTWHCAVMRVDKVRTRLVQDPIWLTGADGEDFTFDATVTTPVHPAIGPFEVQPGTLPGTVRFRHGDRLLTAGTGRREVVFEPDEGQTGQDFLLIGADDLDDLRHVLAHRWRLQPSSQVLGKADIRLVSGFGMQCGPVLVDLAANLPLASHTRRIGPRGTAYVPPPSFVIRPGDEAVESIEIADAVGPVMAPALQFELVQRRPGFATEVNTREAFMRGQNCRLTLPPAEPRYVEPPMVMHAQDRDLFVRFLGGQTALGIGFVTEFCQFRREAKRYVSLCPGCEGLVFDQDGAAGDLGMLERVPALPVGFTKREGRVWVERATLSNAPRLEGPLIVFYDGMLDHYTAWLTGAMPALDSICRHVPRNARLLLPASLSRTKRCPPWFDPPFEHREIMNLLGYGRLPIVLSGAELVFVDDVIFMDRPTAVDIPAEQMRDFRERVLLPFDGPGEPVRRIYLKRADPDGVQDRHEMEVFLGQQGFEPIVLEHMPHEKQINLFREAAFVVGSYGAGLCNIVFAKPGLRVLELMDDSAFRPDLWQLCGKLGHMHGFVGCKRVGQDWQSRLAPDPDHFKDLYFGLDGFRN